MPTPLETVAAVRARCAEQRAQTYELRRELERAVRRADKSGASLREIAAAAGVSHETVRRIIREGGKR